MRPYRILSGFTVGGERYVKPAEGRGYYIPSSAQQRDVLVTAKCLMILTNKKELALAEDIMDGRVGVVLTGWEESDEPEGSEGSEDKPEGSEDSEDKPEGSEGSEDKPEEPTPPTPPKSRMGGFFKGKGKDK